MVVQGRELTGDGWLHQYITCSCSSSLLLMLLVLAKGVVGGGWIRVKTSALKHGCAPPTYIDEMGERGISRRRTEGDEGFIPLFLLVAAASREARLHAHTPRIRVPANERPQPPVPTSSGHVATQSGATAKHGSWPGTTSTASRACTAATPTSRA